MGVRKRKKRCRGSAGRAAVPDATLGQQKAKPEGPGLDFFLGSIGEEAQEAGSDLFGTKTKHTRIEKPWVFPNPSPKILEFLVMTGISIYF